MTDQPENDLDTITYDAYHVPDEAWDIIEDEFSYDRDLVKAYMECNNSTIDVVEDDHVAMEVEWDELRTQIDEAYQGRYASDAEFAESIAEDMGLIPREYSWPHSHIDWSDAARDLMIDFYEEGGYYFRSL